METVADWLVGAGSTALMIVVTLSWLASVRAQKSARTIPIHGGYFVRVATAPMMPGAGQASHGVNTCANPASKFSAFTGPIQS